MVETGKKDKKITPKKAILIVAGATILLVIGFFCTKIYLDAPRDLGSNLLYVGKWDSGNIFGFDQLPSSDYFFATTMSKEDVVHHLTSAGYKYLGVGAGGPLQTIVSAG